LTKEKKIGALVLAAGQSTRFHSARPKLVHPLSGRPILEWLLRSLRAIGADPIVVVVGRHAEEVERACGPGVRFAVQSEPRGTGHAVLAAREALASFRGPLLVLNGDLPLLGAETMRRLVAAHVASGGPLTMLTARLAQPRGWGRILRRAGAVTAIVEERDATEAQRAVREVNVGVYCVDPALLFSMLEGVTPNNAQGEIYLTDIVARAVHAGIRIGDVTGDASEVGQINDRGELAAMEKALRARINAKWMEAGVTFEDPDTAYVGPDVRIGRDTVIGPNVHLHGRTAIGEGCRLDGSAFLTDSTVGDRTHVLFGVVMTEAEVGTDCRIGPFAHLRPATRLAREVHIGDFVETKNASLGRGTKANHLAYLGDADIGSEVNVGAGTITCNYDGFRKSRTVIGDRVQIGSDTQLVAPVKLGDDVYVASGTTVRREVPAGALVFNPRGEQHRAGWVEARRAREGAARRPGPRRKRVAPKRPRPAAKKGRAGKGGRRAPA
jgi:bifunctional UDP-N-acetylglucosamine pyrophosphorylase/glucosamine-1-phosphate N-acetyltransferase